MPMKYNKCSTMDAPVTTPDPFDVCQLVPRPVQFFLLGVLCAAAIMLMFENRGHEIGMTAPASTEKGLVQQTAAATKQQEQDTNTQKLTQDEVAKYVQWAQSLNSQNGSFAKGPGNTHLGGLHNISRFQDPLAMGHGQFGMP
jgi:hypothetical protein